MYLENRDVIDQPLDVVFKLVRDDLPKIVPYLQNIKKIEVVQLNHKDANFTEIINHWYAKVDVPSVLKAFVKEELFSWKDKALWNNQQHYVEYELESFWGNDLYDAKGKNYFTAISPQQTELRVTCNVTIYPDKIPGVPKFLAKKILPTFEEMIKNVLKPNLSGLGRGLSDYFAQQTQGKSR